MTSGGYRQGSWDWLLFFCDKSSKLAVSGAGTEIGVLFYCVESELSRHPRHTRAVDRDCDLPLPHTRDATTLLCSIAQDDN